MKCVRCREDEEHRDGCEYPFCERPSGTVREVKRGLILTSQATEQKTQHAAFTQIKLSRKARRTGINHERAIVSGATLAELPPSTTAAPLLLLPLRTLAYIVIVEPPCSRSQLASCSPNPCFV